MSLAVRFGLSLAIGLTIAVTDATASARAFDAPIEEFRLPNGLRVVLAPDPALSDVSVAIRYHVGSADDPAGKDGLAHLVEHLMFAGSRHVTPPNDYFRWIARVGGLSPTGTTEPDRTLYVATVPAAALPVVFWLESDRMGFLPDAVTQGNLDREVRIVADEMRGRVVDRELAVSIAMAQRSLFPEWHPYHRDSFEWGLPNCTLEDVVAFWRTWYGPANATIAVAGNFRPDVVHELIARYFGDLAPREPPARPALPASWAVGHARTDVGASVSRDWLGLYWKTPALGAPGDTALDVAAKVFADPDGRLQHDLVSSGLALAVSAGEASMLRASMFSVGAGLADGADIQRVQSIVDGAVSALATSVGDEECTRAKRELRSALLARLATSRGRAAHLARWPEEPVTWALDRYDAIHSADVAAAVRSSLIAEHKFVLVVHHGPDYPERGIVLTQGGAKP